MRLTKTISAQRKVSDKITIKDLMSKYFFIFVFFKNLIKQTVK